LEGIEKIADLGIKTGTLLVALGIESFEWDLNSRPDDIDVSPIGLQIRLRTTI